MKKEKVDRIIIGYVLLCIGIFLLPKIIFAAEKSPELSVAGKTIFNTIKSYFPYVKEAVINSDNLDALSGYYSTKHFTIEMGSLVGEELYLFPDRTYYHLRWADILELTIYDKGSWNYKDGILELNSDKTVPQSLASYDKKYLPIYYQRNIKRVLLLMGMDWHYAHFKEAMEEDIKNKGKACNDFILDIYTFNQRKTISLADYKKIKDKLFSECWRPDFFK